MMPFGGIDPGSNPGGAIIFYLNLGNLGKDLKDKSFSIKMAMKKSEKKEKPIWLKRSKEEVESLVLKLAQQGLRAEKIGLVLRDTYGIPSTKLIADKITKILEKSNMHQKPSDLANLEKRAEKLKLHFGKNKQDKKAKRGLQLIEARIIKLEKYYDRKKGAQK